MSRSQYSRLAPSAHRQVALSSTIALLLAGCSMFGGGNAPATTGSIATPVDVQQPLPPTLAYSDAAKIGQAAAAAFWQADAGSGGEWINRATGSSGTVEGGAEATADASGECRPFSTIVTSIGGVHHYSGDVCRSGGGRSVVRIDERSPADRS